MVLAVVRYDNIDVPIPFSIETREATSLPGVFETDFRGTLAKCAVTLCMEEPNLVRGEILAPVPDPTIHME